MQIYQYNISTALEAILNLSHGGMHTYELFNFEKKEIIVLKLICTSKKTSKSMVDITMYLYP